MKPLYILLSIVVFTVVDSVYAEGRRGWPEAAHAKQDSPALPPDCGNAVPISCGTVLTNQTTSGGGNDFTRTANYSCLPAEIQGDYNAPDRIYRISVPERQSVRFILDVQQDRDLDMFLFNACFSTVGCTTYSSTFNRETGIYREVMDVTLEPGVIYYLVVDGFINNSSAAIGSFSLSVNCNCACTEPANNEPDGFKILSDDFGDYVSGQSLDEQSTRWRRWSATADSPNVTTLDGGQTVRFQRNGAVDPDMLYLLNQATSGVYRLSWNMRIEPGKRAYYDVQRSVPDFNTGSGGNFAFQVYFNGDGAGELRLGDGSSQVFPFRYPEGVWFRVVNLIDVNGSDFFGTSLFINNDFIAKWNFNEATPNPINRLSAISFYAIANADFHIDNLCIWQQNPGCTSTPIYMPVCSKNGLVFNNESLARCALYTSFELWPCYTACDLGGTFVYRGDQINGGFTSSDFGFTEDPLESCTGFSNVPYFMDVYIFYQDDEDDWNINFNNNGDNRIQYFIFGCKVPTGPGGQCRFERGECYVEDNPEPAAIACNRMYYITVIGPLGATYNFNVIPTGPCPPNPDEIPVETSSAMVNGSVGANNFGAGQYTECYNGPRSYNGGEKIYKFTLTRPSSVNITLSSPGAQMGMFLSSFVCGNDCIDFAETSTGQSTAQLNVLLNDGTYYIIIDKASTAGSNNFSLTTEAQSLPLFYSFASTGGSTAGCVSETNHHVVQIQHTAFNFSASDQIHFLYPDADGRLTTSDSLYRNWHNLQQPMLFRIPADLPNDGLKCSYAPGDTFIIYMSLIENGARVIKEMIPTYRTLNPPGVTATNTFAPNGRTIIDSFYVRTVQTFGSQTLELNPPAGASNSTILFSTNIPWGVDNPAPGWITLDPSASDGAENISATFTANPGEAPRSAILRFYSTASPTIYRQYIKIEQRGVCNPNPALSISATATSVCMGDSTTLAAAVGPGLEPVFRYAWSTGDTSRTIRVSPTTATTYSVTITNLQPGCNVSKTSSIVVNIAPEAAAEAGPARTIGCSPPSIQLSGSASAGSSYLWQGPGILSGAETPTPLVNTAGSYLLRVTNAFGCQAFDSTMVSLDTLRPLADAGAIQTLLCNPNTVQLSGSASANANVQWSGPGIVSGGNTLTPVVNAIGTYTLTVTSNANGCTATDAVEVNANTMAPTADAGAIQTLLCNPNTVQLGGSASANTNVQWSGPGIVSGGNTLTPVVNATGTYTLTVTSNANGCTATDAVEVNANTMAPTADAGAIQTLLCNPNTVQLSGSASANTNVQWSGPGIVSGGNTLTPVVNAIGTYTLTVTSNANGCTATDAVEVNANTMAPTADAGPVQTLLCNPNTVQLSGSASANTNVQWSGPGIVSGGNTLTPVVNATGTYTLTVTSNANGCTATDAVEVNANTMAPTADAGAIQTLLCNPNTVQLGGSASANTNVQWSGPGIVSGGNTLTPVVNATGTYTLTVTSNANGCTATDAVEVNANTMAPTADAGAIQTLLCNPNTVQLGGSASANANVQWSGPGIVSGGNTLTPVVNAIGTYTLTVTSNANGCTATDAVEVNANTMAPTADAGAIQTLLCNPNTVQLSGSASANTNVQWSGPGIVSGGNTLTPTVNQTGVYTLTVTNPSNGCTSDDTTTVTASMALPQANAGPPQEITCLALSAQFQGSASTGPQFTYLWSGPGSIIGETTLTPTVQTPGLYTLMVTNTNNNCMATSSTTLNLNNTPPEADAGEDVPLGCVPDQVLLFGSGSVGSNIVYQWTGPGIVSGANQLAVTVNQPGAYILTVRNTANGCENADQANVTPNNQLPIANAGPPRTLTCVPPTIFLNGSGSVGAQYLYTWDGPGIVSGSNAATVEVNLPGQYTFTVTNINSGCTMASNTQVAAAQLPEVSIAPPPLITCANDRLIQLSGSFSPSGAAATPQWIGPGIVSGGGTLSPTVNQSGTYTLTVTLFANGCTGSAQTSVVEDLLPPPANAGNDTIVCRGAIVQLGESSAPAGLQYNWMPATGLSSPTSASPLASPDFTQWYYLQVRNTLNQCIAIDSVLVTIPPDMESSIAETTSIGCFGDSNGELLISIQGGIPNYIVNWSNGGQGTTLAGLTAGSYTAFIRDAIGCTDTAAYVLAQPPLLSASATLTPASPNQNNGSISAEAQGGTPPYHYRWMDGALVIGGDEPQIDSLPFGDDYHLEITDANGCLLALGPFSIVVGTYEPSWAGDLQVFPNPNFGEFYLKFTAQHISPNRQVIIGDVLGRTIARYAPDEWTGDVLPIDLRSQQPGWYWVKVIVDGQMAIRPVLMVKW